jgi:hypothetical protein
MRQPTITEPSDFEVFVPVAVVYPGVESNEQTLVSILSTLNRNEALILCARCNTVVAGYFTEGADFKAQQGKILQGLCSTDAINRINRFILDRRATKSPPVFFRGQLLELYRWVARHCPERAPDPEFFANAVHRENFAKAALICGDLWSARVYGGRLASTEDPNLDRLRVLGPFRKAIEESGHAPNQAQTFGRGWSLFCTHLPRRYPQFSNRFLAATGFTVEDYLILAAGMTVFTRANGDEPGIFSKANAFGPTTYANRIQSYLALEAQSAASLATGLWGDAFDRGSYRALRERPILVGDDDRAAILDPIFFGEKISIGPLFHVLATARGGDANEIFGAFGFAFEDYACEALKRIYPSTASLVQRLSCSVRLGDYEIDAVLDDVDEVVFFEMKAAWLPEGVVLDQAYERLVESLRAKYGVVSGNHARPKGVAQLARIINLVLGTRAATDRFGAARVIFPVLLVHDINLNAPVFGHFLNNEFGALLNPVPRGKVVAPLTLMTVSDLELLESSLRNFSLRGLLSDYSRAAPDRMISLHNFIARSKYGDQLVPNTALLKKSEELLETAIRRLFPHYQNPA